MPIDQGLVEKALATLGASPANREYFFAKLRSPEWLGPLRAADRFRTPVHALREKGGITFVPWPESAYLARVAIQAPDLVRDIILETKPTDNERVHQDFVEAATRMTPSTAADVAKFETAWIREQPFLYTLYPEKVGELISYLAKHGQQDAALSLARELLALVTPASQDEEEEEGERSFKMPSEPRGKCRQWEYQRVLSMHIPDLVQAAPEQTLRLLSDLLGVALRIRSKGQHDQSEDYSWIWRPEIASKNFDNFAEALVSATRDAAVSLSTSAEMTTKAVDLLWSRKWRVFRRLSAHTLRVSQTAPIYKIEEMLVDPLEYQDFPGHSPEFDKLLTERFVGLTEQGKSSVFAFIERGPDLSTFKQRRELEGKPATEDEVAKVVDHWQLRWLHLVRDDLPTGWREKLTALATKYGEPSPDSVSGRIHSWVGPTCPKSTEELERMSADEVVAFLRNWKSTGEWNAPSAEGIGRALAAMLATEPQKLAANAALLRGLDPTYVRSAIDGFAAAAKNGKPFDWSPVIVLCEWVVQQGNETKEPKDNILDVDPDWNWTRKSIGWFLIEALKVEGEGSLPISLRGTVWDILEALSEDPPPVEEAAYGRGMFAGSISLNVTRGVALDGMLQYARWLHRQGVVAREHPTLDPIPELKRVLDLHIASDNSVAASEVLGRNFPTLFWLDKRWAISAASAIFGDKGGSRGEVAWANYLLFCPGYDELLPLLADYYRKAISRIGAGFRKDIDEIDRHLAQHIVFFYWRGKIGIDTDDALIADFFRTAPPDLRAHAIETIGRSLYGAVSLEPEVLNRLRTLWEWRLAELKQHRSDGEAIPFGIWFASGQFDLDWSFENLLSVLTLSHKIELDFWVAERLASVANQRPAAAVKALGMMIEGDREGWSIHGWGDNPRTVLTTALGSTDPLAHDEAQRVIHLLGSRGWYGYRDLLRATNPENITPGNLGTET
jgi:hypothetical protein